MFKSLLLGGVLGGLAVFIWGVVSWMVLPWHAATLLRFQDEAVVTDTLSTQAPVSGVYLLPNVHADAGTAPPDAAQKLLQQASARLEQGSRAFVAFKRDGMNAGIPLQFAEGIALQIGLAVLVSWLLQQTQGLRYLRRVFFVTVVGMVIALASHLPNLIWWQFSLSYTLVQMADALIGWFIAGIVIALACEGRPRARSPLFL